MKVYLDNYSYNRPFDDQSQMVFTWKHSLNYTFNN